MRVLLFFGLALLPLYGAEGPVDSDAAAQQQPLECLIQAAHKGGQDITQLNISLKNVGEAPLRVMMPCYWYDMSAGTHIGGWEFHFTDPEGKPAKLDWGTPPPSPKPLIPGEHRLVVLHKGESVGMTLPLKGQLADLKKVSSVTFSYEVMEKYEDTFGLRNVAKFKQMNPPLWEGKVQSTAFDIRRFVTTRPKKQ